MQTKTKYWEGWKAGFIVGLGVGIVATAYFIVNFVR